jgi:hypothetical protein
MESDETRTRELNASLNSELKAVVLGTYNAALTD